MYTIRSWGIPSCLESEKLDLEFKFNDSEIKNTKEDNYHCHNESVKFCLYNTKKDLPILSMDFFGDVKGTGVVSRLYNNYSPKLKLELLFVHQDEWRRKGIASYYIDRLKEYASETGYEAIEVNPIANDEKFKYGSLNNSLSQKELESFYNHKSDKVIPIELTNQK